MTWPLWFLVPGGAPRTIFIPLKVAPGTLFSWLVTENPSGEVATKDHSSLNPRKGNPLDLKTKVDVKGFPSFATAVANWLPVPNSRAIQNRAHKKAACIPPFLPEEPFHTNSGN